MKVLGINGGNGVILYPFKEYLISNVEPRAIFHTKKSEQWKANFGNIPLYKDLESLYKNQGGILYNIDSIVSAPDCGHSSLLAYSRAKKLKNPKENKSLNLFIQSIQVFNPKCFLMENLPKLLEQFTEEDFRNTFPGYNLIFHTESVRKFGNSQVNRIRLIIIGVRKDYTNIQYQFSNIYKVSKLRKCKDLCNGLDEEDIDFGNVRENINDVITIYAGTKLSLHNIRNYWLSNPTQKRYLVSDRKFTTAPGVYRNCPEDFPATARKANRQFNSEGLQLTPRELARIQGVPDSFSIYIDPKNKGYWINKGRATVTKTPPYEVGLWFYNQCKKITL